MNAPTNNAGDIAINKASGIVTYSKTYTIVPFRWAVYPERKDRFCAVIVTSPNYLKSSRLMDFVLNAFIDPHFLQVKGLHEALKAIGDLQASPEQLRGQVAIFDLSAGGQFAGIHPNLIGADVKDSNGWLMKHQILKTVYPNWLLQSPGSDVWNKNYSHTIWLASALNEVPKVLQSNSHLIFMTESETVKDYVKEHLGVANMAVDPDAIFVVGGLERDLQLMSLQKERFTR